MDKIHILKLGGYLLIDFQADTNGRLLLSLYDLQLTKNVKIS
jgi:hypothetical protein